MVGWEESDMKMEEAKYNGIALVDTQEHQHGIINPIQILEGEITLMEDKR